MSPLLDTLAVWGLIGGALGFFILRHWRARKSGKACGGGCCPVSKGPVAQKSPPDNKSDRSV